METSELEAEIIRLAKAGYDRAAAHLRHGVTSTMTEEWLSLSGEARRMVFMESPEVRLDTQRKIEEALTGLRVVIVTDSHTEVIGDGQGLTLKSFRTCRTEEGDQALLISYSDPGIGASAIRRWHFAREPIARLFEPQIAPLSDEEHGQLSAEKEALRKTLDRAFGTRGGNAMTHGVSCEETESGRANKN